MFHFNCAASSVMCVVCVCVPYLHNILYVVDVLVACAMRRIINTVENLCTFKSKSLRAQCLQCAQDMCSGGGGSEIFKFQFHNNN